MRDLLIAGFVLCGVIIGVLIALGELPRSRIASSAHLFGHILRTRSGTVTVVLFWWWVGWHFLVAPH
ncbi:MAG TPA: DUF6186 family protein [Rhodanobacteraceae bacterium]|nr:DUF6186 family protein [Rhodanobacteraceae bacterium]